ncbi:retrovirus-related pol polyprotein from transposon TNT 1-94 [Tanacetum coccineum]
MVTVRTFLAVATPKNWDIHQMDVHNAFLHGDLKEELAIALKRYGFHQSTSDYSCFTWQRDQVHLNVLVYVDDLIISGNDGLLGAKHIDLPLEQNHNLHLANGKPLVDPRLVVRLIYISVTRDDLSYCVHMMAQLMQSPLQEHWNAAGGCMPDDHLPAGLFNLATLSFHGKLRNNKQFLDLWLKLNMDLWLPPHGNIAMRYVPTHIQAAHIFTKALGNKEFDFFLGKLGIHALT